MSTETLLALVKRFEGLKLKAYKCPAGVWTIGYGHTAGVVAGMKITKEQAEALLEEDLGNARRSVQYFVKVPLTQNQLDALTSFVFNVGAGAFGRSTLVNRLNERNYSAVPVELKKWIRGGGKELPGLVTRREAESTLWLTPDASTNPLVTFSATKPDGDTAKYTRALQTLLQTIGLYAGDLDGWPGKQTSDAVEKLTGHKLIGDPRI